MTPLEIDYLSPRVPRPLVLEETTMETKDATIRGKKSEGTSAVYETIKVPVGENVKETDVRVREWTFSYTHSETGNLFTIEMRTGDEFTVNGEVFIYAGIVEDASSADNGKPIAHRLGEADLYEVFTKEQFERGSVERVRDVLPEELHGDFTADLKEYWQEECAGEKEYPAWVV